MTTIASLPLIASAPAVAQTEVFSSGDERLIGLGRTLAEAWKFENECYQVSTKLDTDPDYQRVLKSLRYRKGSSADRAIMARFRGPLRLERDIDFLPVELDRLEHFSAWENAGTERRARELAEAHRRYKAAQKDLGIEDADRAAEEASRATSAIVEEIEATPARSFAGLMVKVQAVRWCRGGDLTDEELSHAATDTRLCQGILLDLAELAGRPETCS